MPNSDLSACRAPAPLSDSQRSPRCARSCVAARHYTPRTWRVVLSQSSACHPTQVHAAALVSRLASRVVSRCVRCFSRRFAPRVGLLHSSCAASHSVPHFVPRCVPRFALRFEPRFVPCCVFGTACFARNVCGSVACLARNVGRASREMCCVSRETYAGQLRVSRETCEAFRAALHAAFRATRFEPCRVSSLIT